MRRLVTSDWQLDSNPRDRYRLDFVVKTLPELIDKYKVDQLLVLGDLTEAKDNHPASLVNEIVQALMNINKKCQLIILEGNHDYLQKGTPFFEFIKYFPGKAAWLSVPIVLDRCLFLPHTRNYKQDWKNVDFEGHDYIFAHNIFTGVNTQTGHALSGIPTNIFPDDAMVISGDVHEPQSFDMVTYVGSPCLCDFGDDYQPRVLLLDGLKAKSVKVYGQQKRLVSIDWPSGPEFGQHNANENDIVKIQVHITMEGVAKWSEIRQEVERWAIQNKFIVSTIVPVVAYVEGERQKLVKSVRKTDYQYVDSFVKRVGADEKTADVGKELIEEE